MTNVLNQYFPMIRSRQELLEEIGKRPDLKQTFESWSEEAREEFLDFCSGVRGVRILYDSFFREVMNPESSPERMEDFLGRLLFRGSAASPVQTGTQPLKEGQCLPGCPGCLCDRAD